MRRSGTQQSVERIVLLTAFPFSERDHQRFGVEIIKERFDVSVVDCTPWLRPDLWEKYSHLVFACPEYVAVSNYTALLHQIELSPHTVAIDYLALCAGSEKIRRALRTRNVLRAIVDAGALPSGRARRQVSLRRIIMRVVPWATNRIRTRIRNFVNPESPPDIALLSGTSGLEIRGAGLAAHKIWGHSFDYDIYLQMRRFQSPSPRHAVFLDEDMIYHPDYDHLRIGPPTTEGVYYGSMRRFFDEAEPLLGMPVVVAAHPRSNQQRLPTLWRDYATVSGRTAELVRDAKVVFCHQSTSVSFAVLWKRPVIALTTTDISATTVGEGIALMSKTLGAPLINVDCESGSDLSSESKWTVNEEAYSRYRSRYIKVPGSPDLPLWEIFCDYIQRTFPTRSSQAS